MLGCERPYTEESQKPSDFALYIHAHSKVSARIIFFLPHFLSKQRENILHTVSYFSRMAVSIASKSNSKGKAEGKTVVRYRWYRNTTHRFACVLWIFWYTSRGGKIDFNALVQSELFLFSHSQSVFSAACTKGDFVILLLLMALFSW